MGNEKGNKMNKRNDPHCQKNLIVDDYQFVLAFNGATTQDKWPIPPFNVDRVLELAKTEKFANIKPGFFTCDVCGTHYIYGEVWRHIPTNELITIGHVCAAKYEMIADCQTHERQYAIHVQKAIREAEKAQVAEACKNRLAELGPEVAAALEFNHPIINDIRDRFHRHGFISDKQAAFIVKLAAPKVVENEKLAEVPELPGRTNVEGVVLGVKVVDSPYGMVEKMLVKVETPDGIYKLFGSVPRSMQGENIKGHKVRFSAMIQPKELGFGFFSRPTAGAMLSAAS